MGLSGINILTNGNFVIRSVNWNGGTGAVTWGSGVNGFIGGAEVVVSAANSLVGSATTHSVGNGGVLALSNGHYVVRSTNWDDGPTSNVGAVTWCNGFTGRVGVVSTANSLTGSQANDQVGNDGIYPLTNGNYVIASSNWRFGAALNAGAATFANAAGPIIGAVSAANSLIGTNNNDRVGQNVVPLKNGNYVVVSTQWNNVAHQDAGAITWGSGTTGVASVITSANSLIGITTGDQLGTAGVYALANGNYVICSDEWDNGADVDVGAATWGDGTTGISGTISPANSLVGTLPNDRVGLNGVIILTNGHYVILSPTWTGTGPAQAGAATWGNGFTGITGEISAANSLVGASPLDQISSHSGVGLTNGNYVISSRDWDNGSIVDAGAVTWGNGKTGTTGTVSPANSLVGKTTLDRVGGTTLSISSAVTPLFNGHYVVSSNFWDNGSIIDAGAVTWCNGNTGRKGTISPANSLVGTQNNDSIGWRVLPLNNGHYVVGSKFWRNVTLAGAGAATWCNGFTGRTGAITPANSLVGTHTNDEVGDGLTSLLNGNYLVRSQAWFGGRGAATWGNGKTGSIGEVSEANSLIGNAAGDFVGNSVLPLPSGDYMVSSSSWSQPLPALTDTGARTLGNGTIGTTGVITRTNSVIGGTPSAGASISSTFDITRRQLIVGDPDSNRVVILGNHLTTLAKTGTQAPGAADIAWGKPGALSLNDEGGTLFESTLTGSGSSAGRNKGIFGSPTTVLLPDLVMQQGDLLDTLFSDLPTGSRASLLAQPITNQPFLGIYQATAAKQRLLFRDNGTSVSLIFRTGRPIPALGNAQATKFNDILQNHAEDTLALHYALKPGTGTPAITTGSDTGLLLLTHGGSITATPAREGASAAVFGPAGTLGQFTNKISAAQGGFTHFISSHKPPAGPPGTFVGLLKNDLTATANNAISGQPAPTTGQNFSSFPAVVGVGSNAYYKALLTGPASGNESLWRNTGLYLREGDDLFPIPAPSGITFAKFLRIWPGNDTATQLIILAELRGTGVTSSNKIALILRQSNNTNLILLRTGDTIPGTGGGRVKSLAAIDVHPRLGSYAILATLSGTSASANQALLTGNTQLGDNTTLKNLRLPLLRLRKGERYSTAATPLGTVRSISLRPAPEPTGAGGRGHPHVINSNGQVALHLTTDRNLTELVLLPPD